MVVVSGTHGSSDYAIVVLLFLIKEIFPQIEIALKEKLKQSLYISALCLIKRTSNEKINTLFSSEF